MCAGVVFLVCNLYDAISLVCMCSNAMSHTVAICLTASFVNACAAKRRCAVSFSMQLSPEQDLI